jgi:hypothetical protein
MRNIEPKITPQGVAVSLSAICVNNAMLQNDEGYASFSYSLFDKDGNLLSSGGVNVGGDFCATWDGNYNDAYNYIANYLGVVII